MRRGTRLRLVASMLLCCLAVSCGMAMGASADDSQIPSWATWHTRERSADIDRDGIADLILLHGGDVSITGDGGTLFCSPDTWEVSDVYVCDIDHDGGQEVVFLVWKQGSYGESKPFWVKTDDTGFSQHVFVYRWKDGALEPVWMSSALGKAVRSLQVDDTGTMLLTGTDGSRTSWVWDSWGFTLESDKTTSGSQIATLDLLAVGDNIAHETVYEGAYVPDTREFDFKPIYAQVRNRIRSYDIAVVCQETALVSDPALRSGYPDFATPQSMGDALVDAGFDVVLAATNHVNDIGQRGIDDTLAFWSGYPTITLLGIHATQDDASAIDYVEKNGIKLTLFDYTFSLNGHDLAEDEQYRVDQLTATDRLLTDLTTAEGEADLSVCFLHIGEEYDSQPTEEQQQLVLELIDAGADVVICSHAHVLEPYGRVTTPSGNSGVVFYGLGNFMSHQTSLATILGGAASIHIEKAAVDGVTTTQVTDYELDPTVCHYTGDGATTVYYLDDYTDALASQHYVNTQGESVSMQSLWGAYVEETTAT